MRCFPRRVVIERNDAPIRRAEGLELTTGLLHGTGVPADFAIETGGLRFAPDLLGGQKTGFYLDQVDNYQLVAKAAKVDGACWIASRTRARSPWPARGTARLPSWGRGGQRRRDCRRAPQRRAQSTLGSIEWREANVFDLLPAEERRGAQYDLIILDPPSFTKVERASSTTRCAATKRSTSAR